MDGDNLKEVIQSITEGCIGYNQPSQHVMYFIYKHHESNVHIVGTRFATYIRVKAVAGSLVEKRYTTSHQYAITHNSSPAWFSSDNPFE